MSITIPIPAATTDTPNPDEAPPVVLRSCLKGRNPMSPDFVVKSVRFAEVVDPAGALRPPGIAFAATGKMVVPVGPGAFRRRGGGSDWASLLWSPKMWAMPKAALFPNLLQLVSD